MSCINVSKIVAINNFDSQTGDLPQSLLFTTTDAGLYRINVNCSLTAVSQYSTSVSIHLKWTNEEGPQDMLILNGYTAPNWGPSYVLYAKAITSIYVYSTFVNPLGSYNIDCVLEQF